jgi:rSAM/selenodomain-associated transferase 1
MSEPLPTPRIILFAKAPVPGRVKTRLHGRLTPSAAAALHEAMVEDTLSLLSSFSPLATVELHTDVPTSAWPGFKGARHLQSAGDLGHRLLSALQGALEAGSPLALILGSDSPGLPPGHIERLLDCPGDLRLGPAADGGYYAIAARRVHSAMFADVRWSSPHTLADTLSSARSVGLSADTSHAWFDIDEPASLARLHELTGLGPATTAWLAAWRTSAAASE